MRCLVFGVYWWVAFHFVAWGQEILQPDDALQQAQALLRRNQVDSALYVLHRTRYRFEAAKALPPQCSLEFAYEIGRIHYFRVEHDSALWYLEQAARLAQENGYLLEYGRYLSALGGADWAANRPVQAVRHLRQAVNLARQVGDSSLLADALGELSSVYINLGLQAQVRELQHEARRILEKRRDTLRLSVLFHNIGETFKSSNLDSMLHYRLKAYELVSRAKSPRFRGEVIRGLAEAYHLRGELEQALTYYHRAVVLLSQSPGNWYQPLYAWAGLMGVHAQLGQRDSANYYANRLANALQSNRTDPLGPELHLKLARHYEAAGLASQALHHYRTYAIEQDSVQQANEETIAQLFELENQIENENLRQQALRAQIKLEKQRQWVYGVAVVVLILLLVVAVLVVLRLQRLKRQQARALAEVQQMRLALEAANEELREISRFRELLLGTIVHDLKTPLNSIMGLTMLEPSEQNSTLIYRAAKKMLGQVHDLLDVQRLEAARLELKIRFCLVDELLAQAADEVRFELEQRHVDLSLARRPGCSVACDANLIQRVLVNLLTNAIKFSPRGGLIEIQVDEKPDGLWFHVLDEGPGVPEHLREVIFERYTQGQGKDFGTVRSTGLGLTFCKLAVEAHGGRIGVTNRPTGGACFCFSLPQVGKGASQVPATRFHPDAERV